MMSLQPGSQAEIPAIVLAVRRWNRVLASRESAGSAGPAPASCPSPRLSAYDWHRAGAAAERALLRYPGPVGLLIHHRIRAYQQQAGRWPDVTLVARIIDELQAQAGSS